MFSSIQRGDVSGSSFGFQCKEDTWADDENIRLLVDCELFDAGPVAFPAYPATSVQIRSLHGRTETIQLGLYHARSLPAISADASRAKVEALMRDCLVAARRRAITARSAPASAMAARRAIAVSAMICNCVSNGERSRMRSAPCRTIVPFDREALREAKQLEEQIWLARRKAQLLSR